MQQKSSGFGDENESPVLGCPKSFNEVNPLNIGSNHLENLNKDLLLYLKKQKNIPRDELKSYLEQISKIDPPNCKIRWLLKRIEGLLKYILKKRGEFTNCLVKGEVVIWGKSLDTSYSNFSNNAASPPRHFTSEFPLKMLTNNDFITPEENIKMETDNRNLSEDLFKTQELHNFAQENYQLLKNVVASESETQDYVFKMPESVEKVFQMHENLEENLLSIVGLNAASVSDLVADSKMEIEFHDSPVIVKTENENIFDDIDEPNQDLAKVYNEIANDTKVWMLELISNLQDLEIRENRSPPNSADSSLFLNQSQQSLNLETFYSEENYQIIKETVEKYKNNNKKHLFDFFNL